MLFYNSLLAICIFLTFCTDSHSQILKLLPENELHLDGSFNRRKPNIKQREFQVIMEKAQLIYEPIVASFGGELKVYGGWYVNTVNAYANQKGGTWEVTIYGGLARRPEITPDAVMLIVCHELGHHLGGYPFVNNWASVEGQSDYYATHVCAPKMWSDEIEKNTLARLNVDPNAKIKCDSVYANKEEQNLCYRISLAGQSLANLLGNAKGEPTPSYGTPSTLEVDKTNMSYPDAQCRLDSYLAGGLCKISYDDNVIPGDNFRGKRRKRRAEQESLLYNCSQFNSDHSVSMRPKCWFAQREG
mgnify:CR=1 FL=1